MSELASAEKLRKWAQTVAASSPDENIVSPEFVAHECARKALLHADEIEREITERYIELPVDADGVPIRVGDKVAFRSDAPVTVTSIGMSQIYGQNDCGFYGSSGGFYGRGTLGEVRHVEPRTIEDVLRDMIHEYGSTDALTETIAAKYAAELRGMMEADE